jgi:TfoX/Sxy family transcriptional regulator of competence genes
MAYDENLAARVRRLLSTRQDVAEKRMVGGLSFLVDGGMACGVTGDALMVRVGSAALERALAEPHVQPMEFAGRRLAGFVCVDPQAFPTDAALAAWVQRGLDFASTLPAKRSGTGRKRP